MKNYSKLPKRFFKNDYDVKKSTSSQYALLVWNQFCYMYHQDYF